MVAAVHRWAYIVHLRKQGESAIMEISGTFAGTYMQAFAHIQALARQNEATVVSHSVNEIGQSSPVIHRKEVKNLPAVVKPAPLPKPDTPPQGCEWSEKHIIKTQEYSHHDKANLHDTTNRVH